MPKISLSPKFIHDSLLVLKQRGLKGLVIGETAELIDSERQIIHDVTAAFPKFSKIGAKRGELNKIDAIHRGKGTVYLVPLSKKSKEKSLLLFADDTRITNGPDLWLYLSKSGEPKKDIGEFINLGLLNGNKGGQIYEIDRPIDQLADYKAVIIYCKQFEVLFSYAVLS